MSQYIHFTEEQKAQARKTDIVSLLKSQGETVKRSGSEYEWKDGSQKVTIRGNLWYHQYDRVGGDAIDFVRRFYNKSYPEAMEFLLGNGGGTLIISPSVVKEKKYIMIREKWYISKKYKDLSMEILQDNLSALRARADITQEELANILGISRQTYYAIESKKKQMSWNIFMSMIFFFHELKSTSEMLKELKIYPIDLILRFNGS